MERYASYAHHLVLRLADRQPPDRVPSKPIADSPRAIPRAAPCACRPGLCRRARCDCPRAPGASVPPSAGKAAWSRAPPPVGRIGGALVEYHRDVGIERALYAHRLFRREKARRRRPPATGTHALLRDLAQRTQAPYLETAGIRQDRPVPAHEAVQPAMRLDYLHPGAQPQVKVLPSTICAPISSSSRGRIAFTVPRSPPA